MNKPSIIQLLIIFSKKERLGFQSYLTMPFVKDNLAMQELLNALIKLLNIKHLPLDWKTKMGKKLYPNTTNIAHKIDNQLSDLKKYAEQYLIILDFQKNQQKVKKLLPEVLNKRKAHKLYSNAIREQERQLTENPTKDIYYYQHQFQLYHQLHLNPNLPAFCATDVSPEKAMEAADGLYVLTKLRYSSELLSKKEIYNQSPNLPLLNAVQQLASSEWGASNPLFYLYQQLLQYHQQPTYTEGFAEYIEFVNIQLPILPKEEQIFIFFKLLNLTNWRKQRKIEGFEEILSSLYIVGEAHNLLLQEDVFNDTLFVNIIINKCKLEEFEEAKRIIDKYSKNLPAPTRTAALLISNAYLCFCQAKFQEAICHLTAFNKPKYTYHIRQHILLISTYIELEQQQNWVKIQALSKVLTNFQRYLNRPENKVKVSTLRLKNYKYFITMVKAIRTNADYWGINQTKKNRLLTKLNKFPSVVSYEWLKRKINNL